MISLSQWSTFRGMECHPILLLTRERAVGDRMTPAAQPHFFQPRLAVILFGMLVSSVSAPDSPSDKEMEYLVKVTLEKTIPRLLCNVRENDGHRLVDELLDIGHGGFQNADDVVDNDVEEVRDLVDGLRGADHVV